MKKYSKGEKIATRVAYSDFLIEEGKKREDLIVMDADLSGSTKTKAFADKFPKRFIQSGISEQDLMAEAAGVAATGYTVCASSFAMFATGRAYEIIRNSIAYNELNVKICATHAGITVGEDGASHQTFEDISLMRNLPGMIVINPADAVSARKLLKQALDHDGPAYVRLGRSGIPVIYDEAESIEIGKAKIIKEGKDVTIFATGVMVDSAIKAEKILKELGIDAEIIDIHTIKPIDKDAIISSARKTGKVVTAEEHSVIGGLGSAVAEVLAQNLPTKMAFVGQQDTFGESGKPDELRKKYGMTEEDIVSAVKGIME